MHNNAIAVLFALASALTIAWGTVVRHRIAEEAPDSNDHGGAPILTVITKPLWWAGMFCALGGYGLQVVALAFGTLLVVQPVLVLSLMFTLPLSARYDGRRISLSEMGWAGLLTVAVTILVLLGRPLPGHGTASWAVWAAAIGVGAIVLGALDRYAHRQIRREKALLLGVVTGALFGYVAVFSKAAVDSFVHNGIVGGLLSWETWALVIGAALGTAVQQSSFNAGALKNSLPAMTISEPIVAFTLGYLVLGEHFQVHGAGWIAMGAALAAMIVSTVILSRHSVD